MGENFQCCLCKKKTTKALTILNKQVCINCEKKICSIEIEHQSYEHYKNNIKEIWSDFIEKAAL